MVPDLWSARFQGFRKTILQLNMKFNKNKLHACSIVCNNAKTQLHNPLLHLTILFLNFWTLTATFYENNIFKTAESPLVMVEYQIPVLVRCV